MLDIEKEERINEIKEQKINEIKKERQSNIELLRIIAMIMIIIHHLVWYTSDFNSKQLSNKCLEMIFFSVGLIGVNIFVFITGYLQNNFKFKKIIKLWLELFFYSTLCLIICKIFNIGSLKSKDILKMIFPISYNEYWFLSTYIILYFLTPFINKITDVLSKETYKKLIIILGLFFVLAYSIFYNAKAYMLLGGISFVAWFVYIYLVGRYIKIYDINIKLLKDKNNIILLIFSLFIIYFTLLICIGEINFKFVLYYTKMNSIFVFTISFLIFYLFKQINIKKSKIINYLAGLTFPVYLLHENYLIREIAWNEFSKKINYFSLEIINTIIKAIIAIFLIFIITSFIELIRRKIEKIIMKNKKLNNVFIKIDKIIN